MATEWYGDSAPEEIIEAVDGGSGKTSALETFENSSGEAVLSVSQIRSLNFDGSFASDADKLLAASTVQIGNYLYLDNNNAAVLTLTGIENLAAYSVVSKSTSGSDITFTVLMDNSTFDVTVTNASSTNIAYRGNDSISPGLHGWAISENGDAIFNDIIARGNIQAESGTIGLDTSKWYIGNELNNDPASGIISTWEPTTNYPGAGLYGVQINSEGFFEAYAPIDINPSSPDVFTVTTVSRHLVGGTYYLRYTTSINHNILPGQGVFISGLSRYNNPPENNFSVPVFDVTSSNTFDINEGYIADSWTSGLTGQSGTVRKAQRIFGISSGDGESMEFPTLGSFPPSGLYFANSTRTVGTYIASSGQTIFRGIKDADDSLSSLWIEIDPEREDINEYYDSGTFSYYINPGTFTIRSSSIGLTFDSNEIQGFSATVAGGIEYRTGNQISINPLGGNVLIGQNGGSQDINIHGSPVNINYQNGSNGNIYLGHYTSSSDKASVYAPAVYYQTQSTRAVYIGSAGLLGTQSSTRRVKSEINVANISEEVDNLLNLELVTFKYNNEIEELGLENAETKLGFIAEQAQELGLTYLYESDEDGIADYFAYDRLSLYMFIKMKRQQNKIEELEERLAILEG
jgi:hypothetical protein